MTKSVMLFAACAAAAVAGSAQAGVMYSFDGFSPNSVADVALGEAQLSMQVSPGPGANQVQFTFSNSGPAAMSITDVYFDDGTLLGIATIVNGPGVDFSQGASPGDLPGGNNLSPAFVTSAGFSADSNPPAQPNGANPGEWLTIIFNLLPGVTFADTIEALAPQSGALRVGIHVQGFATGGSESFVHVPAPASGLMVLGAGLAATRRRRAR
jgi:hypothetical protein